MKRLLVLGCAFVLALALSGPGRCGRRQAQLLQGDCVAGRLPRPARQGHGHRRGHGRRRRRQARARAHAVAGERAEEAGRQRVPASQLEGPDGAAGGRRPALERLQRLARLRRRGWTPRLSLRPRAAEPAAHEARGARAHRQGARDHRPQADAGRSRGTRRRSTCGPLHLDATRPRVDHARGQPPSARLFHRAVAGERQGDQELAQGERALVRARREPGRVPVHVPEPRHQAVAEEPAGQQRERDDRGRRRRRSEPQLPGALELRQRGLFRSPIQRYVSRARPRRPSPRRRRSSVCTTESISPST